MDLRVTRMIRTAVACISLFLLAACSSAAAPIAQPPQKTPCEQVQAQARRLDSAVARLTSDVSDASLASLESAQEGLRAAAKSAPALSTGSAYSSKSSAKLIASDFEIIQYTSEIRAFAQLAVLVPGYTGQEKVRATDRAVVKATTRVQSAWDAFKSTAQCDF